MIAVRTSITRHGNSMASTTIRSMSNSVPETMKAAVVRETGDAHMLKVETNYPTPKLQKGQVIVKNEYAGINFIDTYHRSGMYKRC
mmetsp:Transcript_19486/g.27777  ORF Transcript_19486/g.27777 Transcript_19486/m.27777 type:complete len:86 (+) Transcript_19486:152-409(+)